MCLGTLLQVESEIAWQAHPWVQLRAQDKEPVLWTNISGSVSAISWTSDFR